MISLPPEFSLVVSFFPYSTLSRTHGSAETAGCPQVRILVAALCQRVVDSDLAELVDDHLHPVHARVRQQRLQQGGLPTAEEAGQDRDRHAVGGGGGGIGHAGSPAWE